MSNAKPLPHRDLQEPKKYLFTLLFPYFELVRPPKYFTSDEKEPPEMNSILFYLKTYSISQIKKVVRPRKTTYIFYRSMDPKMRSKSGYAGRIEVKENYDNTPAMSPDDCLNVLKKRVWDRVSNKVKEEKVNA